MRRCVLFVVAAGGCAAGPDLAQVGQGEILCPGNVCGANSPTDGTDAFSGISRSGRPNEAGLRLARFDQDGVPYDLDVVQGRLIGTPQLVPVGGVLAGQALVGAQLVFERDGGIERHPFTIRIARVRELAFPVGDPDLIEAYVLEYTKDGGVDWRNVCASSGAVIAVPPRDGMGMQSDELIAFGGDRFDLNAKTVAVEPDLDWITLGCAGHVLAKLQLTRNTIASTPATPPAVSFAARQATLKLLVADYCGDGTAFTVPGQRVLWQGGLVHYNEPIDTHEALWSERGAICLDLPRLAVPTTPEGPIVFPDIEAAIAATCARPPSCWETPSAAPSPAVRTSGNPAAYY